MSAIQQWINEAHERTIPQGDGKPPLPFLVDHTDVRQFIQCEWPTCGKWFDPGYEGYGRLCDSCYEYTPDAIGDRRYHEMVDEACCAGGR